MPPPRTTFRPKADASDVCWQRLKRDQYLSEGAPAVPLDLKSAIVRPVGFVVAKQVILKYEWLGTMPTGANRHYGIFFGPHCAGVTAWCPAGFNLPSLAKMFKITGTELAYLARGACVHWAPPGTNSKLIAWSLRYEQKRGSKLAVAFSDSDAGEIGTVYQASNWTYVGRSDSWPQPVSPEGRVWSFNDFTRWCRESVPRLTASRGRAFLEGRGWKFQATNPKRRYVYVLDRSDERLVAMIGKMALPYPKRGGSETVDTPGNPPGKAGTTPSPPLQPSPSWGRRP